MKKLPQMGDPVKNGIWAYVKGLFFGRKAAMLPLVQERRRFEEEMREQFIKLREKGLGIQVFTL